jgi:CRP-like cAMP-binding protein
VQFLIEGSVRLTGTGVPESTVSAPGALGFEEVLEGRPLARTASAVTAVVCLAIPAGTFLTMLSDNRELAQGVFRLVLASRSGGVWVSTGGEIVISDVPSGAGHAAGGASPAAAAPDGLTVLDKALRLRQTPLLSRATVDQLVKLAAVARGTPIERSRVLATEESAPAIYHVLAGGIRIEGADAGLGVIAPGESIGAAETLAGLPVRWRITGEWDGSVLVLGRDELFEVLSGDVELLQGLFSGALRSRRADRPGAQSAPAEVRA